MSTSASVLHENATLILKLLFIGTNKNVLPLQSPILISGILYL